MGGIGFQRLPEFVPGRLVFSESEQSQSEEIVGLGFMQAVTLFFSEFLEKIHRRGRLESRPGLPDELFKSLLCLVFFTQFPEGARSEIALLGCFFGAGGRLFVMGA